MGHRSDERTGKRTYPQKSDGGNTKVRVPTTELVRQTFAISKTVFMVGTTSVPISLYITCYNRGS